MKSQSSNQEKIMMITRNSSMTHLLKKKKTCCLKPWVATIETEDLILPVEPIHYTLLELIVKDQEDLWIKEILKEEEETFQ